jgi:hypothetical protein
MNMLLEEREKSNRPIHKPELKILADLVVEDSKTFLAENADAGNGHFYFL